MRLNYDEEDKVEVQMSPLIDCVFLLLIFFLVDYYDEEVGNANTFITSFNDFQLVYHPRRRGSCYHSSG